MSKKPKRRRAHTIADQYNQLGMLKEEQTISDQLAYEWDQDFSIMKWAFWRLHEVIERNKKKSDLTDPHIQIAYQELKDRIE